MTTTFRLEYPLGLVLLLLIPLVVMRYSVLATLMGRLRAVTAIGLRSAIILLVTFAICEPYLILKNEKVSVLFLIDRSLSIANEQIDAALSMVRHATDDRLDGNPQTAAGVITFGHDAAVESPVSSFSEHWDHGFGTKVNQEQTNIEGALQLADAIMPDQGARRVVLVSDGAETLGEATLAARRLAESGIGIDVVQVAGGATQDIYVEKVDIPTHIRPGAVFDTRVAVNLSGAELNGSAKGDLEIVRIAGSTEATVSASPVTLTPGRNTFLFRQSLDDPGFYSYEARFTPHGDIADRYEKNNRASTFVQVTDSANILVVVEEGRQGEFDWLEEALLKEKIRVQFESSPLNFAGLADLQKYDLVILADIPRYLGGNPAAPDSLGDASLELVRQNTEVSGCGLLMIGGVKSFGNGDWKDTAIEKAMPVDFDIKNTKLQAVTSLILVIDSSGSMQGEKTQLCRAAARAAVNNLKPFDYIGVISFDSSPSELVSLQKASNRQLIGRLIGRLGAGGGTDMYPAMEMAYDRMRSNPAAVKHVILLTDGQTPANDFLGLAERMKQSGISISSMAIGDGADVGLLGSIADAAGGQFYNVVNPSAIPKILINETRRIARPLIYENASGFRPLIATSHPILDSIPRSVPPLTGYVLTTLKDNALVESLINSPLPVDENYPILATWQYGFGRAAAWTTDTGQRWGTAWNAWQGKQQLFVQLVRWLVRPQAPIEQFQLVATPRGGQVEILLTALTDTGDPWNHLSPVGGLLSPKMLSEQFSLEQIGPGRYRALADANEFGNYIVSVSVGAERMVIRSGFSVGYSDEFRLRNDSTHRLTEIASVTPHGGRAGQVATLPDMSQKKDDAVDVGVDFFRSGLDSRPSERPFWHLVALLGSVLLLFDVANRRIAWTGRLPSKTLRSPSRKPSTRFDHRTMTASSDTRFSNSRFEPADGPMDSTEILPNIAPGNKRSWKFPEQSATSSGIAPDEEPLDYTTRLKKAKEEAKRKG